MDKHTMQPKTEQTASARARRTYGVRRCPEGDHTFTATHINQLFCGETCQKAHHQRTRKRGQTVATLLQAHRLGRNTSDPLKSGAASAAHSAWCTLVDRWNEEDREAGRLGALDLVIRQSQTGFRDPIQPKVKPPKAKPATA